MSEAQISNNGPPPHVPAPDPILRVLPHPQHLLQPQTFHTRLPSFVHPPLSHLFPHYAPNTHPALSLPPAHNPLINPYLSSQFSHHNPHHRSFAEQRRPAPQLHNINSILNKHGTTLEPVPNHHSDLSVSFDNNINTEKILCKFTHNQKHSLRKDT